jgi:phosphoribosyl 1,2-cyclic phosphate phosphodiesterase
MSSISIEFLGTGTSQGVPVIACDCHVCISSDERDNRTRTAALVRVGDRNLLLDAGPDLRQQMLRCGVRRLDGVLLTHEHMDHIAGIDELRSFNFHQREAMDLYANAATLASVRRIFHYAFSEVRYPGVPELRLHEIANEPFMVAGVDVVPVEVLHHKLPVLGFRIGGLGYITDAKTIAPSELDKLRGVDVLILNALRKKEHLSHLNLQGALELVREIGPRQAFFTHISHLLGRHEEVMQELPPGVELAWDGLKVEVGG